MTSITVKIPVPKPFEGKKFEAKAWLYKLRRYYKAVGLQETEADDNTRMLNVALALMSGQASKWLERLTQLNTEPTTWTQFEDAFLKQYAIIDDENRARDRLKEIRQVKSVQQYISAFDEIMLSLPSVQEQEFVHSFIYGLKIPLKGFVKAHVTQSGTTDLTEVMQLALQYEDNTRTYVPLFGKQKRGKGKSPLLPSAVSGTRQNGPLPMDLNNMRARHRQQRLQQRPQQRPQYKPKSRFPSSYDKSRVHCNFCGKMGHFWKECDIRSRIASKVPRGSLNGMLAYEEDEEDEDSTQTASKN